MIKYPSTTDIIEINRKVLQEIKVKKADRSALMPLGEKILENIIEAAKHKDGDMYDKAVILLKGLIQKHPFESGNRRTALVTTASFLEVNGEKLNITHDISILQGIRERYYKEEEIKKWLQGGEMREFKRWRVRKKIRRVYKKRKRVFEKNRKNVTSVIYL